MSDLATGNLFRPASGTAAGEVFETLLVSPGFKLDELDTPLAGGIDTDSIKVDSTAFQGGSVGTQAFNSSNEAATFDGPALAATIDTKEISSPNNRKIFTNAIRPEVEGAPMTTITVAVGKRDKLDDNVNFSPARALNDKNGEANIRTSSFYQRFRLNITGGFKHANGVKPIGNNIPGGRR